MSTRHFWFSSGNYSLLGHLESPRQNGGRVGVLIVPPFGWEDVCSYRPLRSMAQSFASSGIPTLRYDLPGTGDSSGDANDPDLFESWIQSVGHAAAELRNTAEVEDVAVVGIHLGAMLAMAAAARGADLRHLVLWGPAARGRTILRELRAFANMERGDCLSERDAPPQPMAGFETGGFLIAPETLRSLDELDLSALPWRWRGRILLLSRDDLPHDARLMDALRTVPGAIIESATGCGYSAMTASPQDSVFPGQTSQLIAGFLLRDYQEYAGPKVMAGPCLGEASPVCGEMRSAASPDTVFGGRRALESVCSIKPASLGMFGILTEPGPAVPRSEYCLLYLNAGGVRHIGPNRMWVESARRWAANGVASLRFDLRGIGESDGEQYIDVPGLYKDRLMDQIEAAINSLRRHTGMKRFIAIGLCSGACWAFHAAVRNPDVQGAILVNPSLLYWDPAADRRRMIRSVVAGGITGWADWTRMIRVGIQRGDIRRGVRRIAETFGRAQIRGDGHLQLGFDTMSQAWCTLEQQRKRVALVFREGEPLLAEMESSGQLPPDSSSLVRCVRVPNGGHTLRPLWAQKLVHDVIDAELSDTLRATLPLEQSCWIGQTLHARAGTR